MNMVRAVCMSKCVHWCIMRPTFVATMAIGWTPRTAMVSTSTATVPAMMATASMTLAVVSKAIASSPVAASTTSLSSQPSPPYTSLYLRCAVESSQKLMLYKCPDPGHIIKCTALFNKGTLTGPHSNHDCLSMALQKVTNLVHPSIQRLYSTLADSFVQGHSMEGAEKMQPASKAPDSSADLSAESKRLVVVVESPTKATVIQNYLGPDFIVLPSYGHVRNLAPRAGSVRPDDDYTMVWEVSDAAQPHVTRIKNAIKGAKCLVFATDPDSEGEALAWHVYRVMKAEGLLRNNKVKVVRVAFNEITKSAVLQAMQAPRKIIRTLVNAYLARRALDYLVGFTLSPLLWRKLPGTQSAGLVQSTALKLVCDREIAVEEFVSQGYWTVELSACCGGSTEESTLFPLCPIYLDGQKIEKFSLSCDAAQLLAEKLESASVKVSAITKGSKRINSPEPYTSSTLQQEAQAKLGFGAMQTMNLAQKLYEGVNLGKEERTGLITYMRTDGHQLSKEAVGAIRAIVVQRYGNDFLSPIVRGSGSKVKNAQVAQEAIRPTNMERIPSALCHTLEKDALALYTLIWRRTVECQMEQAVYEEVAVDFMTEDGAVCLQATGSHLAFPGFLAVMKDNQASLDFEAALVPNFPECQDLTSESWAKVSTLKEGDLVLIRKSKAQQYFTQPPARYSEGLLIKAMDELGIGRPSTLASTLQTLQARNYVKLEDHQIIPEVRGRMTTSFLSQYIPRVIDSNFTARLEEQLEEVSGGHLPWKKVLRDFWPAFYADVSLVTKIPTKKVIDVLHDVFLTQCCTGLGVKGLSCPRCGNGQLTLKLGRYGSDIFLACNSYRVCSFKVRVIGIEGAGTESLSLEEARKFEHKYDIIDVLLGKDPATNLEVRAKDGPFGFYIQLGEEGRGMQLFRVPHGVELADLTLEKAIELMKYPLNLGNHPEDGRVVILGHKESSYFVRHHNTSAVVPTCEKVEDMTLERALELLKGCNVTRRGRKSLAVHAAEEEERKIRDEKRKARLRRQFDMSMGTVESKSRKVAANEKAKKITKRNRAKLVGGKKEVDKCVEVVATAGGEHSDDIQGKDTDFLNEAKIARI